MSKRTRQKDKMEVVYSPSQWELLRRFREQAVAIMDALSFRGIVSIIHGSVARGDVNKGSDVDIVIPYVMSSHSVELALVTRGFKIYTRKIAQATPSHTPKAHIYLDADERQCVTFPLVAFRTLEDEFYKFGGLLELKNLKADDRVSGCDKRLMLIEPTPKGHVESPIQGREAEVARIVGVSVDIVNERVRVLMRREEVGRTGIVLSLDLMDGEVFEEALKKLAESNPIVRRRIMKK